MSDIEIPTSGPDFEAMMAEVESKLRAEGVEITRRPLLAVREVSIKYDVAIPLAGDPARMPEDLRLYAPVADAIERWYNENYGDRLKVDPCPGRTVVALDGDLYTLKVPRILGGANFVVVRQFLPNPGISNKGPPTCNVVQLVEDITAPKASRLSDDALREVAEGFERALPASYTLECTQHELMYIARGDIATAISSLMDKGERYGESKWASLQAAEKVLKAAIDLQGGTYKKTHGLKQLCDDLARLGITFASQPIVDAIQCSPAIRYGQEACTRDQALAAHQASLDLVNSLRNAGAKFELGLG